MKIKISKKEKAMFDGRSFSNGHFIIDTEILQPSKLELNEPYATLIEKGIEFSKIDGEIIVGQKELPIDDIKPGNIVCSLLPLKYQTDSHIPACGFVHWEHDGESGVIRLDNRYYDILRQITEQHKSILTCDPQNPLLPIGVMDGDQKVGAFMPLRTSEDELRDIKEAAIFLAYTSIPDVVDDE